MARLKTSGIQSRKEQILDQAAALFKTKGFNATTMRHLAEHLQMEAASLYNHISSKEELLRDICFFVADQFNEHLAQIEADPFPPAQKIENLLRFHIHMLITRHNEVYVSNRDWKHLKEPHLSNFLQTRRQYENRLAAIVQQGIELGQFRRVHPHVATLAMLSTVRSIEYWQRSKRQISSRQVAEDLITLILKGMEQ
ncbi:MAG TPA: TetR/AcrR family transcriptional regulator [Phnomibacter sp.]|nr:TetR/AcrR family transcriptional regulator [Phnomibacter sp.]